MATPSIWDRSRASVGSMAPRRTASTTGSSCRISNPIDSRICLSESVTALVKDRPTLTGPTASWMESWMPFLSLSRVVTSHHLECGSHQISDCSGAEVRWPGSTICASACLVPSCVDVELEAAMLPVSGDIMTTTISRASDRRSIVLRRASVSIQPNLVW